MNAPQPDSPESRFIELMSEFFQLREAEELDFGIYRVIKRHNRQVRDFLGEIADENGLAVLRGGELAGILETAFQQLDGEARNEKKAQLQHLGQELGIKTGFDTAARDGYLTDLENIPAMRQKVLDYRALREELTTTYSASADRAEVLNRLYEFFARHYQDGDFIVQRRYGRNSGRYIKSSGEDTEFHWATEDMYYIKSGDVFTDYPVRLTNGERLIFSVNAETLQQTRAELKPTDKASYKLQAVQIQDGTTRIILDYLKGSQTKARLDEIATQAAAIAKTPPEEIARHLRRYIARNQSDFFIHKRLRETLDDDLDIFIKTKVLNADQLLADDSGKLPDRTLRVARVIRRIGRRINAFLGVLEDFQKRLWEKKKLVLATRYVITLDRLDKLAGREFVEAQLAEILANTAQVAEWKALGLGDFAGLESVRRDEGGYLPLPIDTQHFSEDFQWELLAAVTKNNPLDESLDGVAIHSDNWQALNTMQDKYWEQVKCIYIDPPYNTDASTISYKNGYRSASWVALMSDRLITGKQILSQDGILCATIDDFQHRELKYLIEILFNKDNLIGTVAIRINPSGRPAKTGFALSHEYALFSSKSSGVSISKMERTEAQAKRYKQQDSEGSFQWELFRKRGSNSERKDRAKLYYPIYVTADLSIQIPAMIWNEKNRYWEIQESVTLDEKEVWPIDDKGIERTWRWAASEISKDLTNLMVKEKENGSYTIYYKFRPDQEGVLPTTTWIDAKYSATEHGTGMLKKLFKEFDVFSYPKSVFAVEDCIAISGLRDEIGICIDFFAGSGTTAHAILNLNDKDGGRRQFIICEINEYFDMVTIARIKKVGYSLQWDSGAPLNNNGPGLFMRVQRFEQYEDTLENLATATGENQNLFSGPEALAYELDAEARHLLLAADHFTAPFGLTLKRIAGADVTAGPVDLVESLIYLLGLRVNQLFRQQGSVIITGLLNRTSETAAIFWRDNLLHDADWLQTQIADYPANRYYTNDPARVSFPGIEQFSAIETVFIEGMNGNG